MRMRRSRSARRATSSPALRLALFLPVDAARRSASTSRSSCCCSCCRRCSTSASTAARMARDARSRRRRVGAELVFAAVLLLVAALLALAAAPARAGARAAGAGARLAAAACSSCALAPARLACDEARPAWVLDAVRIALLVVDLLVLVRARHVALAPPCARVAGRARSSAGALLALPIWCRRRCCPTRPWWPPEEPRRPAIGPNPARRAGARRAARAARRRARRARRRTRRARPISTSSACARRRQAARCASDVEAARRRWTSAGATDGRSLVYVNDRDAAHRRADRHGDQPARDAGRDRGGDRPRRGRRDGLPRRARTARRIDRRRAAAARARAALAAAGLARSSRRCRHPLAHRRASTPATPGRFVDALADDDTLVDHGGRPAAPAAAAAASRPRFGDAFFGRRSPRPHGRTARSRPRRPHAAARGAPPVCHVGRPTIAAQLAKLRTVRAIARSARGPPRGTPRRNRYTSRRWPPPSTSATSQHAYGAHRVVRGLSLRARARGASAACSALPAAARRRCCAASPASSRCRAATIALSDRVVSGPGLQRAARAARHRHGVPGLRAVPAPHRRAERRVRACAGCPPAEAARARRRDARRSSASRAAGDAYPARALRRPAAARRARPRARAGARPAAARRAVLQPRHRPARAAVARGARRSSRPRAPPRSWSRTTSTRRSRSPTRSAS